jgi:anaerobic selenocysteine-containing dehydrogenase
VTMQPEHHDLYGAYGHLYLQWNEKAVEPPGECVPNNEVFRRLATALGLDHPRLHDSDLEIARQILDTDACRERGITLESLRERGWQRAAGFARGTAPFATGGFPAPGGKVMLLAPELEEAGLDPLVGYTPPHEVVDEALRTRYPLVLMSPAARFFLNSTFASLDWHRRKTGPLTVHLHPDDAAARELAAGDPIRVFNDRGAFEGVVSITDATRPGVAFTFKSYWPKLVPGGANANATTPERDADLGGAPTFHDNRVEVEPLAARPRVASGGAARVPASTMH